MLRPLPPQFSGLAVNALQQPYLASKGRFCCNSHRIYDRETGKGYRKKLMMIEHLAGASTTSHPASAAEKRDVWQALRRGAQCRCPACGEGDLFEGFLKIAPQCTACGEALHHHRADDLPPYIVITIVGHIIVTLILVMEMFADFSTTAQMILWPLVTLALTLVLMRPVKGAVVGYQWALHMHGFGGIENEEALQYGRPNNDAKGQEAA
jgi:uncharacterized protein (DUF983 family)